MVLPLITFPYLIRVLGFEGFGLVNYALALVLFFVVFVDFGYNLAGTRDVAAFQNDTRKLSKLFSEKWVAQLLLLVIATLIFSVIVLSFNKLRENWTVHLLIFVLVLAKLMDRIAWQVNAIKPYFFTLWLKPLRKIGQFLR